MKKKFILIPILLLVLVFISSLPCDKYLYCEGEAMNFLQYPGMWFLLLIPLSILALTLNNQKHRFWLKFTGVFFVASMFLVYISEDGGSSFMPGPDRELINWYLVGIYSITSVIYFMKQYLNKKRDEKLPLVVK